MDRIQTKSTSRYTAKVTDIELRKTNTTRLVFRPMIIDNHADPNASLKGSFIYQRKSQKSGWEDCSAETFSTLKSGEGYKLELKSAELRIFTKSMVDLYRLHRSEGVPIGEKDYVRVSPQIQQLTALNETDLDSFFKSNREVGSSILAKLLNWANSLDDPQPLIEHIVELNPNSLARLNAALGLESLKRALSIWKENEENPDEEFWQQTLQEHSFVLEQVFSWPAAVIAGKAYVGGKTVFNVGGNIVDFLMRNSLTQNAALIEIKTPTTRLLGSEYRSGIYNSSTDLSGSVMQVSNYRHSLQEDYSVLTKGQEDLFDTFNPKCVVIIGHGARELTDRNRRKSFELFRNQIYGTNVITFDELFEKVRSLIGVLEKDPVK